MSESLIKHAVVSQLGKTSADSVQNPKDSSSLNAPASLDRPDESQPWAEGVKDPSTDSNCFKTVEVGQSSNQLRKAQPWLTSFTMHIVLILVLALLKITIPLELPGLGLEYHLAEDVSEVFVEVSMEPLLAETLDDSEWLSDFPDCGIADLGDTLASNVESFDVTDIASDGLDDIGRLFGDSGDGLAELGNGRGENLTRSFYGTEVHGYLAVVFDITASMFHSVPRVLEALDTPQFSGAQVVAVFGGSFKRPTTDRELIPYRENSNLHFVEIANSQGERPLRNTIYRQLISRKNTVSLEVARSKKSRQSLGAAIEALLNQSRSPRVIFVFSDFKDGVNRKYMQEVLELTKQKKVKIVFYHPKEFERDRDIYLDLVEASGGELKENLPP